MEKDDIILHKINNIKENFCNNIKSKYYKADDVKINSNVGYYALSFVDPNVLFFKISATSIYVKKELIEHFDLKQFLFSIKDYESKENIELLKITDTEEFFQKFYVLADDIFMFYLCTKEVFTFGCCNSFIKCSDLKACVNNNRDLYLGCHYRKHLENGDIFYGKNKTI